MKVTVTKKDIKNGIQEEADSCPIAHSIKRLFRNKSIAVCHAYIAIGTVRFKLNKKVKRFVALFDKKGAKAVKPFSFELKVEDLIGL